MAGRRVEGCFESGPCQLWGGCLGRDPAAVPTAVGASSPRPSSGQQRLQKMRGLPPGHKATKQLRQDPNQVSLPSWKSHWRARTTLHTAAAQAPAEVSWFVWILESKATQENNFVLRDLF